MIVSPRSALKVAEINLVVLGVFLLFRVYAQDEMTLDYETVGDSNETLSIGQRQGKNFLSDITGFIRPTIFNIVRFPNEECLDASNQSGTCYTPLECKKLGGNPSTKCARGLGTCCIMSRTCHNSTYNKVVYFRNPSFPLTDSIQNFCDLTVNIIDADICQLRIDFHEFQIDAPTEGVCAGDKFTVSASGMTPTAVPTLCGNNRNQHLYISLPTSPERRSVSIVFETNALGDYRFHLKVTQIDCRARKPTVNATYSSVPTIASREARFIYQKIPNQITYPAPTGCLQYFTTPTGTIESFNFGQYLNNLDYAICIERQPDTCRIIYTSSDANFGIKASVTNMMPGVGDEQCQNDYLLLAGGSQNGEGITKDRYCGGILTYSTTSSSPSPVISKANGPIVVRFHSDSTYQTVLREGFRVKYEQSPTECLVLNSINPNPLLNSPNGLPLQPLVALLESGYNLGQKKPIKMQVFQNNRQQSILNHLVDQQDHRSMETEGTKDTTSSRIEMMVRPRPNGKRMVF